MHRQRREVAQASPCMRVLSVIPRTEYSEGNAEGLKRAQGRDVVHVECFLAHAAKLHHDALRRLAFLDELKVFGGRHGNASLKVKL